MVHFDLMTVDMNRYTLCTRCLAVPALDVIVDDVEGWVIDHIVGALAHEVEAFAVKSHVMRVTNGRTCGFTALLCTLPPSIHTGTGKCQWSEIFKILLILIVLSKSSTHLSLI